ncbi:UDP-glucuronate:xylan alpha-glucuronosyltransferase 2 [Amborella trichopoda]|uniref:UDP-glucuronate:xylan alpha-glucuronosyltransferase 2 n=1 Tax=Amborella trichopoda TaxID=13333 RepID=UPI0005D41BED|nr:UDP-glucuronate:xylan alpha-glucuronosyltransferase 2 [Amborella trichopoda]|eukprot:XP_011625865.1 UDP-glucuronate:xylan alpha-glucuronosyltransferase 2 [Amborella trichopoda]
MLIIYLSPVLLQDYPSRLHPKTRTTRILATNTSAKLPESSTVKLFEKASNGTLRIALVNMDADSDRVVHLSRLGRAVRVGFERVSESVKWSNLYPKWIDEEETCRRQKCPKIPMPDFEDLGRFDVVVVGVPCRYPEEGWRRDVFRLQLHLIAANLAVSGASLEEEEEAEVKVVVVSECRAMEEIFGCDEMVGKREKDEWVYKVDLRKMRERIAMPVGSCKLALPLKRTGGKIELNPPKVGPSPTVKQREAYATVLHSSEAYVCGAIALAQSLARTGTTRDLVLLADSSISLRARRALITSGWIIRDTDRIHNPYAKKEAYNEWNYTKLRLWQLLGYHKVVFIDSDIIVLKNLDVLFGFPQISAISNNAWRFNSGMMLIKPSNCTFNMFMENIDEIVPYNGGDQGFLNEVFTWWHRWASRVNYMTNWNNMTEEMEMKNRIFRSDEVYGIHYLGLKPWLCYRDYDCNWNVKGNQIFANDVANERWWEIHDSMAPELQRFCLMDKGWKARLKKDRASAKKAQFEDKHWMIKIKDPRQHL